MASHGYLNCKLGFCFRIPKAHMKMRNVEHFFTKSTIVLSFNWRDLLPSPCKISTIDIKKRCFVFHTCEGKGALSRGHALILRLTPLGYHPQGYNPQMEARSSRASPLLKHYYTNSRYTVVSCQVSTIHFLVEWLFLFILKKLHVEK